VGKVTPYPDGERAGQTMTVDFVLNGSNFLALNGGPNFRFNESISFQVPCMDQADVDRDWSRAYRGRRRGIHMRIVEG
jgi:predicted 3-demethylubiquinone-9 3-methyltransferase (glyoxalase superfamily)